MLPELSLRVKPGREQPRHKLGRQYQPAWESQSIQNYNEPGGLQIGSQFNPIALPSLLNYTSGLPPSVEGLDFPPELPTPYTAAGMLGYLGMTTLQPKDIGTAYTYLHQDTRRRLRYDRSTRVYDCL
ncbi:MAG: hypothetical protein WAK31_31110 [Chthoniobacterales bacterium]